MILTDEQGRPLPERPTRAAGEDVGRFLERLSAWSQERTRIANAAFDKAFRAAMRD